jgi:uncharacterized protein (DUF4415 family)
MISFDPDKGKANITKHGVSLAKPELMEWDEVLPGRMIGEITARFAWWRLLQ